ncbi:hypothetical protein HDU96_003676 [Phlyctochytrium bullatum]|nr:hypothetical protein HDU96_003676 [Phlyctochytrium bullatum]
MQVNGTGSANGEHDPAADAHSRIEDDDDDGGDDDDNSEVNPSKRQRSGAVTSTPRKKRRVQVPKAAVEAATAATATTSIQKTRTSSRLTKRINYSQADESSEDDDDKIIPNFATSSQKSKTTSRATKSNGARTPKASDQNKAASKSQTRHSRLVLSSSGESSESAVTDDEAAKKSQTKSGSRRGRPKANDSSRSRKVKSAEVIEDSEEEIRAIEANGDNGDGPEQQEIEAPEGTDVFASESEPSASEPITPKRGRGRRTPKRGGGRRRKSNAEAAVSTRKKRKLEARKLNSTNSTAEENPSVDAEDEVAESHQDNTDEDNEEDKEEEEQEPEENTGSKKERKQKEPVEPVEPPIMITIGTVSILNYAPVDSGAMQICRNPVNVSVRFRRERKNKGKKLPHHLFLSAYLAPPAEDGVEASADPEKDEELLFSRQIDPGRRDSDPILVALYECSKSSSFSMSGVLSANVPSGGSDFGADLEPWDLNQVWLHNGPAPLDIPGLLLRITIRYGVRPIKPGADVTINKPFSTLLDLFHPPTLPVTAEEVVKNVMTSCVPATYPTHEARSLQPRELIPPLHPFQTRAVSWMLAREGISLGPNGNPVHKPLPPTETPLFCTRLEAKGLQESVPEAGSSSEIRADPEAVTSYYVNRLTGACWTEMTESLRCDDEAEIKGGILADEMGLGKTLEIVALVLLHRPSLRSNPPVASSKLKPPGRYDNDNGPVSVSDFCVACQSFGTKEPNAVELQAATQLLCVPSKEPRPPLKEQGLTFCNATLIITPQSIMSQWVAELNLHAPNLRHLCYYGVKGEKKPVKPSEFLNYDIVITTYEVLRSELHVALDDHKRSRRNPRQYERAKSPLVQLLWWRVCLDEAQMVESTLSNASEMARLIPRVHPWCVTGTPLPRTELTDLEGLFLFLGLSPFTSRPFFNRLLTPTILPWCKDLLARLVHRNTKVMAAGDLSIPPQIQNHVGLEFSAVERRYYDDLFDQCKLEVGALAGDSAESIREREKNGITLRSNKKVLGGTLKSIDEVLKLMHTQCESLISSSERQIVSLKIQKAQTFELERNFEAALQVYQPCLQTIQRFLQLTAPEKESADDGLLLPEAATDSGQAGEQGGADGENETPENSEEFQRKVARHAWRELEHRVVFFIACCYNSLKQTTEEEQFYKQAEELRQKILLVPRRMVEQLQAELTQKSSGITAGKELAKKSWETELPRGGIGSGPILEDVLRVFQLLRTQWVATLKVWRDQIIKYLLESLEEEMVEETSGENGQTAAGTAATAGTSTQQNGTAPSAANTQEPPAVSNPEEPAVEKELKKDSYAKNLDNQAELDVYMDVYADALHDRRYLITGVLFMKPRRQLDNDLFKKLQKERLKYVPKNAQNYDHLAHYTKQLKAKAESTTLAAEREIMKMALSLIGERVDQENEAIEKFQNELVAFRKLANARIEYFRRLEKLSDDVVVPDLGQTTPETKRLMLMREESQVSETLSAQRRRLQYLSHLMSEQHEATKDQVARECVICRSEFSRGFMTFCGHLYCEDCTHFWITKHYKCAVCNQKVPKNGITSVSFKKPVKDDSATGGHVLGGPEPQMDGGPSTAGETPAAAREPVDAPIATPVTDPAPAEPAVNPEAVPTPPNFHSKLVSKLEQIETKGSFGTKVDTIVKHLLYIRTHEPGAKSLVFSQWDQVLEILAAAFRANNIGYVQMEGGKKAHDAVKRFREDDAVEVFMLHAKSQSAGLTLVQATHVFLVEPVLNTGLELQALGRVHRIGQKKVTHVYRYTILDTVEERIVNAVWKKSRGGRAARKRGLGDEVAQDNTEDGEVIEFMDVDGFNHPNDDIGLASASAQKDPASQMVGNPARPAPRGSAKPAAKRARKQQFEKRNLGGGELVQERDILWCLFGDEAVTMFPALQQAALEEAEEAAPSGRANPVGAQDEPASPASKAPADANDEGLDMAAVVRLRRLQRFGEGGGGPSSSSSSGGQGADGEGTEDAARQVGSGSTGSRRKRGGYVGGLRVR